MSPEERADALYVDDGPWHVLWEELVVAFREAENDALERAAIVCDRMHGLEQELNDDEQGGAARAAADIIRELVNRPN